jgi:hypothetical protein
VTPEAVMVAAPPQPPPQQDGYQQEESAYDPIHAFGGPTQALGKLEQAVMIGQTQDNTFEKLKKLGQGGFGTVWLCKRTAASRVRLHPCATRLTPSMQGWPRGGVQHCTTCDTQAS